MAFHLNKIPPPSNECLIVPGTWGEFRGRGRVNPSICSHCQFYHSGWINCVSDDHREKSQKISKKNHWSAKALALSNTINHHWHDGQTNPGQRRHRGGDQGSFTCPVRFFTVLLNSKVPTESMTERETLNPNELHPSPQQTAADRRSCTRELSKPHKPRVQCFTARVEWTSLAIQSTRQ